MGLNPPSSSLVKNKISLSNDQWDQERDTYYAGLSDFDDNFPVPRPPPKKPTPEAKANAPRPCPSGVTRIRAGKKLVDGKKSGGTQNMQQRIPSDFLAGWRWVRNRQPLSRRPLPKGVQKQRATEDGISRT